jgi:hypothetical protein
MSALAAKRAAAWIRAGGSLRAAERDHIQAGSAKRVFAAERQSQAQPTVRGLRLRLARAGKAALGGQHCATRISMRQPALDPSASSPLGSAVELLASGRGLQRRSRRSVIPQPALLVRRADSRLATVPPTHSPAPGSLALNTCRLLRSPCIPPPSEPLICPAPPLRSSLQRSP